MSNIVFKGINSDDLVGLLISEQPDIIRPPRRTNSIEIDGRDGDIPEVLGYESYKKRLEVGLYGNYDIDAIINFFSGDGWVIFGNEPTKKYYARIDADASFERLVRFRRAKVDFIVQPYKKLVDEDDVTGSTAPLSVVNQGYVGSKPIVTIVADPDEVVALKVNDITVCTVTMPAEGTIILDTEALNAYNVAGDKNQHVVGTLDFELANGDNDIDWTGTVTSVTVTPNSRFL